MKTALILEDDPVQATHLHSIVEQLGYRVLGPCYNVFEAQTAIDQTTPDFAILDYTIGDVTSGPIQKRLAARNVPFAILTGQLEKVAPKTKAEHVMVIPKPCDPLGLELAVYKLDRLRQKPRTLNS
jgi:DNA-binding response OmpR family regulator